MFGSGQNSDIVLVNSQMIFRFPKYAEGIRQLKREAAFLNRIAGRVPIEVPRPIYSSFASLEPGRAFIGYRKLSGKPLEAEVLMSDLDERGWRQLAGQLGGFLKALHGIETEEMNDGRSDDNLYSEWSELYDRIRTKLYRYMKPEARLWTDRHFTGYLGEKKNFEIRLAAVHGDFGTSNILYDSDKRRISGIIDFGSAGIGDPAVDCAALLASYGEQFLQFAAAVYPEIDGMMDRITFYRGTFALQEALFGLEHEDSEAFHSGLAGYR
ncbi:phosphotransferase family protein [Paenibacillus sp. GCM10012303]|uniref:phosphotransferase family protein n=1 Tax=Paenibacillus sp. GCM10012303 TaxID=3317340 RepID=UPI00360FF77C